MFIVLIYRKGVLDVSEGIENMGNIQWKIALCLLLAWGLIFAALFKGVKSTGKVSYLSVKESKFDGKINYLGIK